MLTLVMLLVAGQVSFVERPMAGVVIGNVTPFTGKVTTNYLHIDVDGDSDADLLMPSGLYLQDKGVYRSAPDIPLPVPGDSAEADVFGQSLYYRESESLSVYTLDGDRWKQTLGQAVAWPESGSPFRHGRSPSVQFRRFLHDFDDDQVPELVAVDQRGIHLYRRHDGHYVPAGVIALPAVVSVGQTATQHVWPEDARKIVFPEQQMSCRMVFDGSRFRTLAIRERKRDTRAYAIQSQSLVLDETGTYVARDSRDESPDSLPSHLHPCRLNGDDTIDFAGGRWLNSTTSPMPVPLYETWATLDGGASYHIRRTTAFGQFRPHCVFVDFDGDGDMDFVTEATVMPRGSVREQLNRFLTEPTLQHEIHVYAQDKGAFSEDPDLRFTTRFTLEAPPANRGAMLSRYESGSLVNLTGDMNGDGLHDVLVRLAPESLALYLAREGKGFPSRPNWTLTIDAASEAFVADINGDGLSDIYIRNKHVSGSGTDGGRVYFAQEVSP